MKKALFFTIFCFYFFAAQCQVAHNPITHVTAVLNAYSRQHANAFNLSGNPASISGLKNFGAGVFGEKRFLMSELSLYRLAIVLPTNSGNFGLSANYFGNPLHNEANIGLTYGKNLGEQVDAGVQFNYISIHQQGYGRKVAFNAAAGLVFRFSDRLTAGLHVYNLTSVRLAKTDEEYLPAIYNMGFCYEPSDKFYITVQVSKVENQPASVQTGLAYYFDKKLHGQIGFDSGTSAYFLGAGIQLNQLRLDAIATVHPQLGLTPGLQLLFERKSASNEKE